MLKMRNTQAALVLLITCSVCNLLPAQQRRSGTPKTSKPAKTDEVKPTGDRDREREKRAQEILENVFHDSRSILNPVVKTKIRSLAANAYWRFQPQKARQIVLEEFLALQLLEKLDGSSVHWTEQDGKTIYKGMPLEQVKARLKRELLATAGIYDPAFFQELLASSRKNQSDQPAGTDPGPDQQLITAGDLAAVDSPASARLIHDSMQRGIDESFSFALMRLRESSPDIASQLFNQALGQVKASADLWQFQRLVPFVLPSEMDRLVGGKHYLTNPQRMQDAKRLVEYGSELLYRRIQLEVPANLPPELIKKEYYLWRNLQEVFEDVDPSNVWLVNARLRQLTSVLPAASQKRVAGPWTEERLQTLLSAADQSTGEKRDNYLSAAAAATWRFGEGDLDKAIALVEKIGDSRLQDDIAGIFYLQAGTKILRTEGPDMALEIARKIKLPVPRTQLFLDVIGSLKGVKATERTDALERELLNWLRNCERNSDTAWALLNYIDAPVSDASDDKFAAFEVLIRVLNSPGLEANGGLKNRVYWHAEFHDFRKSLMPLVRADFERTLELIQMLNNRETSLQIQAAFCANYLKLQSQSKEVTEMR